MENIIILSRNDLTNAKIETIFKNSSFDGTVSPSRKSKNVLIEKDDEWSWLYPSDGDQDLSDYGPEDLPSIAFRPFISSIGYHDISFAADIVKIIYPFLGEGSLVDDDHGSIVSAEAFILKYANKGPK